MHEPHQRGGKRNGHLYLLPANSRNTATAAADYVIVTDTFDPILSGLAVTLDGAPLTLGTDYTYDTATGGICHHSRHHYRPGGHCGAGCRNRSVAHHPRRDQAGHHRHGVNSNLCGAPAVAPPTDPLIPIPSIKEEAARLGQPPRFYIFSRIYRMASSTCRTSSWNCRAGTRTAPCPV